MNSLKDIRELIKKVFLQERASDSNIDDISESIVNVLLERKNLVVPGISYWVNVEDIYPNHGDKVLTYAPESEDTEEEYRIIIFGSLKSGFPSGVTFWKYLDKP